MSAEIAEKILVVEDEPDSRIFLSNLLKSRGLSPITAHNKAEGLQKALSERPSVIILNVMMSGKKGIQFYQRLKQDEVLRNIPVILLSTLDEETFMKCHNIFGHRQWDAHERMDKFMEKPVETDDLLTAVRQLSGRRHS